MIIIEEIENMIVNRQENIDHKIEKEKLQKEVLIMSKPKEYQQVRNQYLKKAMEQMAKKEIVKKVKRINFQQDILN